MVQQAAFLAKINSLQQQGKRIELLERLQTFINQHVDHLYFKKLIGRKIAQRMEEAEQRL